MERNTLQTIIEVEREIQRMLEEERGRAKAWLERTRQQIQDDLNRETDLLQEQSGRSHRTMREEARRRADVIARKAAAETRELEAFSSERIRELVLRHLAHLDPRSAHDRPDGQS